MPSDHAHGPEALRRLLLVVVTDRRRCRGDLVEACAAALRGGATAVLLRDLDLPARERRSLARRRTNSSTSTGHSSDSRRLIPGPRSSSS